MPVSEAVVDWVLGGQWLGCQWLGDHWGIAGLCSHMQALGIKISSLIKLKLST